MTEKPDQAGPPPPELQPAHHSGFVSRIRTYFLTGLVATAPLAITAWLTWSFITWVDDLVRPLIPIAYRPETYLPVKVPGFGLIIAFMALTLLGFFTANLVGRTLMEAGETILDRMPIVRPIYKGLKQVFETLFSKSGSSFRKVGLVQFPSPDMWSLVFLSQSASADVAASLPRQEEYVSVFLPCTPNPTTGFFFYVARSDIIEIDLPVEAAAKLIMSAGLIQPNGGSDTQKKLTAFADTAKLARMARVRRVDETEAVK